MEGPSSWPAALQHASGMMVAPPGQVVHEAQAHELELQFSSMSTHQRRASQPRPQRARSQPDSITTTPSHRDNVYAMALREQVEEYRRLAEALVERPRSEPHVGQTKSPPPVDFVSFYGAASSSNTGLTESVGQSPADKPQNDEGDDGSGDRRGASNSNATPRSLALEAQVREYERLHRAHLQRRAQELELRQHQSSTQDDSNGDIEESDRKPPYDESRR